MKPPLGNKGLIQDVIEELFFRLKQESLFDEKLLNSLSSLAAHGKLTDVPAIQTALQSALGTKDENN